MTRSRQLLVFIVLAFSLFMSALDGTIVVSALPIIEASFGSSLRWSSWVITGYSLGMAAALPVAGMLAERVGHRRYLAASLVGFGVFSLACTFSDHVVSLTIWRILQGASAAGFTPAATG